MCSLINQNATITSWLPASTAWLTAKHYKIFPIRVKYHPVKTIKSTYILYYKGCWKRCPCDSCILVYQRMHCIMHTVPLRASKMKMVNNDHLRYQWLGGETKLRKIYKTEGEMGGDWYKRSTNGRPEKSRWGFVKGDLIWQKLPCIWL
jgi:hypothetical protein